MQRIPAVKPLPTADALALRQAVYDRLLARAALYPLDHTDVRVRLSGRGAPYFELQFRAKEGDPGPRHFGQWLRVVRELFSDCLLEKVDLRPESIRSGDYWAKFGVLFREQEAAS